MAEHVDLQSTTQILSLQLDGDLAREIDAIARQDGVTRSEILRRLLLSSLQTEIEDTSRCMRELVEISGRLERIQGRLVKIDADDAAEAVEDVVNAIVLAIDELEDFEPDEE